MNKTIKILFYVFLAILSAFTYLSCGESGKIFYTSESATYLTDVSNINLPFAIISIVSMLLINFLLHKKKLKISLIIVLICIWLFSTRKVAISPYYEGRLGIGWNCFLTEELFLCSEDVDCERKLAYETSVEKLSLWTVRLKSTDFDKEIFIGPLTWSITVKMLEKNMGYGTYTK